MIPMTEPELGPEEKRRVGEVLESGRLNTGGKVRTFEREFSEFCGAEHGIATANGTAALHAAMVALGIGEGDRVLTTPFAPVATANAVRWCGADPVFVDIDPETYNIDPAAVEAAVRERGAEAVLAVHLFGLPADVARLHELAAEYDLALIEDAAQAHGATYRGERVGTLGDAACFSFAHAKNMTTGEGGMVLTDRGDVAERVRQFIDHGRTQHRVHVAVGHNFRMPEIAGAIGRVQLEKLPHLTAVRRVNARTLTDELADAPVVTPTEPADRRHVYHQYTVRVEDRSGLRAYLADNDVDTAVFYPTLIHEQPAYAGLGCEMPVAEHVADRVLSLPIHPGVSAEDVRRIASRVVQYETRARR